MGLLKEDRLKLRSRQILPESHDSKSGESLSISQGLEAFLLALRVQARSPQTLDLYERSIRSLVAFLDDKPLEALSPGDLRRYLTHLSTKVKPTTVAIRWRSIRAFLNWLYEEGWLRNRITERIRIKEPTKLPAVLRPAEIQALIRAARQKTKTWEGLRNYCLVLVLLDTGIRRGEAQSLTVHDISWPHNALIVRGKTGERIVYFGRRTARTLRRWLNRRTFTLPGEALFCRRDGYPLRAEALSRIVHRLSKAAALNPISCHTLRHTFATTFITHGGDVFSLQQLLGHKTIEMTRAYVILGRKELREAHAKASPVDRLLGG